MGAGFLKRDSGVVTGAGGYQDVEVDEPQREPVQLWPGVSYKLTYRAFIPTRSASPLPPLPSDSRAVVVREFIYALLGGLQRLRWGLLSAPNYDLRRRGPARTAYRQVRSYLARRLVPGVQKADVAMASTAAACIEISRHVILVGRHERTQLEDRERRLICHVYATGPGQARDRLFERFVERVLHNPSSRDPIADVESGAILTLHYERNFAGRRYFELVIGSLHGPNLDLVDADWLVKRASPSAVTQRHALDVGNEAGAADWEFVHEAIGRAQARHRPLDDKFVEDIARKRLARARAAYAYPDAPGAGPTVGTSRRIVRDIVKLHELAGAIASRDRHDDVE
jgi:hypothetical protein